MGKALLGSILILLSFSALSETVTIGWDHPTDRINGDAMPLSELDHYEVSYNKEGGMPIVSDVAVDAGCDNADKDVCFTSTNLTSGTYYFRVKVYDIFTLQSEYTEDAGMSIDRTNPNVPKGLTILELTVIISP